MRSEKKQRIVSCSILVLVLFMCHPITAYGNSSWHWFTEQPLTILPIVVGSTLLLEIVLICLSNQIKPSFVPISGIVLANLLSFLLPVIALGIFPEAGMETEPLFERVNYYATNLPVYMVNIGFLFLTLIAEVPIVYVVFKKYVVNRKRLLYSILIVNCLTTLVIAVIERILFKGSW